MNDLRAPLLVFLWEGLLAAGYTSPQDPPAIARTRQFRFRQRLRPERLGRIEWVVDLWEDALWVQCSHRFRRASYHWPLGDPVDFLAAIQAAVGPPQVRVPQAVVGARFQAPPERAWQRWLAGEQLPLVPLADL